MTEALIGALVSSGVDLLIDKLNSLEVIGFFKHQKLDDRLLNNLRHTMRSVKNLLNDAEEKQIEKPQVKEWLDELKDAVYEADDFFDEIAYSYKAMQLELEAEPQSTPHTCTDQMRTFLSSLIPCKKGMGEMQPELEKILQNLDGLLQQKDHLELRELIRGTPQPQRLPETSLIDASDFCGRATDKKIIIELLQSKDRRYDVIPIVGMAGVGKTTLARLVYKETQEFFDLKGWVYVSENIDALKVTKDIFKELTDGNCDGLTDNKLHTKLEEQLKDKKVLLVLDDVWTDSKNDWDFLLKPFASVKQGSKIVVTTRHESVASVKSTVSSVHLRELSEEDCWVVFEKHAFVDGNSSQHPDLKKIGRDIVKKCQGLPLAARALGDHLRCSEGRTDVEYWGKILNSNIWNEPNNEILPALRLSYHHLPPKLKQCFAYCGMFVKGSEISKKTIFLLWMAEGFLGEQNMEEEGDKCFNGLVSRSFFRLSNHDLVSRSFFGPSNHDLSCFVMHDLLWDLAKSVAGDFCSMMEGADSHLLNERTRHLCGFEMNSLSDEWDRHLSGFEVNSNASQSIFKARKLRSLLVDLGKLEEGFLNAVSLKLKRLRVLLLRSCRSLDKLPDSVGKLKHLRLLWLHSASIERLPKTMNKLHNLQTLVLDRCWHLTELPDWIGKLSHLRCLSLEGTLIERLPESASDLCNLETLNLHGCYKLVELPANMKKLSNLCNLDIGGTRLQSMPSAMGQLVKLKQLSDFFVAEQCGSNINELGDLHQLRGELCIWNLQNVENVGYASAANLKGKKQLGELEFKWGWDTDGTLHHGILEQLQPHTSIKSITIVRYGGRMFPEWLGDSSFSNIVSLHFEGCKNLSSLPPLGHLSSLEDLYITGSDNVTVIGPEFYGGCSPGTKPFSSLKNLTFESMTELQHWQVDDGAFSVLRFLHVSNCPKLTTMPSYFPSVIRLVIEECWQLPSSFPRCPVIHTMSINYTDKKGIEFELSKLDSGLCRLKVWGSLFQQVEQIGRVPLDFEDLEIYANDSLGYFPWNFYHNLKSFSIGHCDKFKTFSLESHLTDFISLKSLSFENCPNFYFPTGGLAAPNLTDLKIYRCSSLQSLPESMNSLLPSLEDLSLSYCPELESFPHGGLPSKLKSLEIHNCDKLIANRMQWGLQLHPSLSKFTIEDYEGQYVESFPEEKLLPSTLTSLIIRYCKNLKSLDYKGLRHLTSLTEFHISGCYNLMSLPEEGLPSSLSSLELSFLTNLKSLDCKGFQHLTSLTELEIRGCPNLQSLSGEGQLSSLSSLKIFQFENLESLDYKWIQHLTSLRELEIGFCPVLESFPVERLPSSLLSLKIQDCPLLAERCMKEREDYWPKIRHIRHIEIDWHKIN